jgi:hypothetical protein
VLFWVAPGLREERSLNLLGGILVGLALISSGFLFWQERRAIRQESRAVRRESREISVEEDEEWTPRAWLYATAFGLSFFLSRGICCQPCSSPPEQATSLRGWMPSGTGAPPPVADSPECVEVEFCELRLYRVSRKVEGASPTK